MDIIYLLLIILLIFLLFCMIIGFTIGCFVHIKNNNFIKLQKDINKWEKEIKELKGKNNYE